MSGPAALCATAARHARPVKLRTKLFLTRPAQRRFLQLCAGSSKSKVGSSVCCRQSTLDPRKGTDSPARVDSFFELKKRNSHDSRKEYRVRFPSYPLLPSAVRLPTEDMECLDNLFSFSPCVSKRVFIFPAVQPAVRPAVQSTACTEPSIWIPGNAVDTAADEPPKGCTDVAMQPASEPRWKNTGSAASMASCGEEFIGTLAPQLGSSAVRFADP